MTTFVPFAPTPESAFAFPATLDDTTCQIFVPWNAFDRRWYLQCIGPGNVLVFSLPLIGSPDDGDINIAAGYFVESTLIFRVSTQTFEVTP